MPKSEQSSVTSEMEAAYAEFDYKVAKVRLDAVEKRIEYKYPLAAERVKHWQSGIQVLRWLSCGFMGAEKKFRKING